MPYDTSVPKMGSNGSADYSAMQGNYLQIQNSFSIDHEPLGSSGSLEGFHKKSTYVSTGSDPAPVAATGIVYTKTPTAHTELFYEGELATGKVLQLTNQSLTTASGQGMLPGGLQIRAGFTTAATPITFTAFPTGIISISLTSFATPTTFDVTGSSTSSISFSPAIPGGAGLYWIAIGY